MFRLSNKSDLDGIKSLWKESFGDSFEDIDFFLNYRYIPQNTLVCEEDSIITSMLFLLEGKMHINCIDYPAYYLYAAATLKAFRGMGIMAGLLDYAKRIAENRGYYFICLMPAEESLFNFYEKHGYKSVFTKKYLIINPNDYSINSKDNLNANNRLIDFTTIRDNYFDKINYFKWDNEAIDFSVKHHCYFGGKLFTSCNGYALYTIHNSNIHVKECAFTDKKIFLNEFIKSLSLDYKKIILNLPAEKDLNSDKFETITNGMILPLNSNAETLSDSLKNAYLSLTLD